MVEEAAEAAAVVEGCAGEEAAERLAAAVPVSRAPQADRTARQTSIALSRSEDSSRHAPVPTAAANARQAAVPTAAAVCDRLPVRHVRPTAPEARILDPRQTMCVDQEMKTFYAPARAIQGALEAEMLDAPAARMRALADRPHDRVRRILARTVRRGRTLAAIAPAAETLAETALAEDLVVPTLATSVIFSAWADPAEEIAPAVAIVLAFPTDRGFRNSRRTVLESTIDPASGTAQASIIVRASTIALARTVPTSAIGPASTTGRVSETGPEWTTDPAKDQTWAIVPASTIAPELETGLASTIAPARGPTSAIDRA